MDMQLLIVIVLFLAALYFVAKKIYTTISPKNSNCNSGCSKCSANFDHIPSPKNK